MTASTGGSWIKFGLIIAGWAAAPALAQLNSFNVIPATASPEAGQSVDITIQALNNLGVAIPLYVPLVDIELQLDASDVTVESISNNFAFSAAGDGLFVIEADGIDAFDPTGSITLTLRRELAGPVNLDVASDAADGATALAWEPGDAHHLEFLQQPVDGNVSDPIVVAVELVDEFGNRVTDDVRIITLRIVNQSLLFLSGVTSKPTEDGVAEWDEDDAMTVTEAGSDYQMEATASGMELAETGAELSLAFARALTDDNGNSNDNNGDQNQNDNGDDNSNENDNGDPDDNDDPDQDDDGIPDDIDEDPTDPDANDNGIPDGDEQDHDDDGLVDAQDSHPTNPDRDDDGHKDGADNCPDHANANQLDEDNDGVGDYCEDDDDDGVVNGREDEGPNSGDGNSDGTPDRLQANVASLQVDGEHMITLVAPSDTKLVDVEVLSSISPADKPIVPFPLGLLSFGVENLGAPGASITVQGIMNVSAANVVTTFYAFGPTPERTEPHWHVFEFDGTTGTTVAGEVLSMQFVDGGRGDDDLKADGRFSIRGGPAQVIESAPIGCGAGCGAGMTLSLFPCLLATRVRRLWFKDLG